MHHNLRFYFLQSTEPKNAMTTPPSGGVMSIPRGGAKSEPFSALAYSPSELHRSGEGRGLRGSPLGLLPLSVAVGIKVLALRSESSAVTASLRLRARRRFRIRSCGPMPMSVWIGRTRSRWWRHRSAREAAGWRAFALRSDPSCPSPGVVWLRAVEWGHLPAPTFPACFSTSSICNDL